MQYNLLEVMKIFSSKTKMNMILHLYTCNCHVCVNDLCQCLMQKQPNISKHIIDLKRMKIIGCKKDKTNHYLFIERNFIEQYKDLLNLLIEKYNLKNYQCSCKI